MAKDTWPDLSTRQGFIEAIEQAGEYIRDHASNLLGEYPSLLCEFDITARFRFDAVPTVEIRREHIAAPLDEYQQRRAEYASHAPCQRRTPRAHDPFCHAGAQGEEKDRCCDAQRKDG